MYLSERRFVITHTAAPCVQSARRSKSARPQGQTPFGSRAVRIQKDFLKLLRAKHAEKLRAQEANLKDKKLSQKNTAARPEKQLHPALSSYLPYIRPNQQTRPTRRGFRHVYACPELSKQVWQHLQTKY